MCDTDMAATAERTEPSTLARFAMMRRTATALRCLHQVKSMRANGLPAGGRAGANTPCPQARSGQVRAASEHDAFDCSAVSVSSAHVAKPLPYGMASDLSQTPPVPWCQATVRACAPCNTIGMQISLMSKARAQVGGRRVARSGWSKWPAPHMGLRRRKVTRPAQPPCQGQRPQAEPLLRAGPRARQPCKPLRCQSSCTALIRPHR